MLELLLHLFPSFVFSGFSSNQLMIELKGNAGCFLNPLSTDLIDLVVLSGNDAVLKGNSVFAIVDGSSGGVCD